MNIYDFSKFNRVFFCSNATEDESQLFKKLQDGMSKGIELAIHPKEIERQERLHKRRFKRTNGGFVGVPPSIMSRGNGKYDNSIIFVTGGVGFGTKDDKFFEEILTKINNLLKNNDSHLIFVRGCNDNPSYFTKNNHIFDHLKNIVLAEDYSIVKLDGFSCICVGGSIPVDRQWKIEQGKRLGRNLFFDGCGSTFNKELIDELLSEEKISVIVTADAPTFVSPSVDSISSSKWATNDKTIIRDVTEQRLVMDNIYGEMLRKNKKPYLWCCAGNDDSGGTINNIKYLFSSSPLVMFDLQSMTESTFGVGLNGEKRNVKGIRTPSKKLQEPRPVNDYWAEAPNELPGTMPPGYAVDTEQMERVQAAFREAADTFRINRPTITIDNGDNRHPIFTIDNGDTIQPRQEDIAAATRVAYTYDDFAPVFDPANLYADPNNGGR